MKVIRNKILPIRGFTAINLFGIVFTRQSELSKRVLRHEAIHTAQMRELLYIGFYLWYIIEWVVRLFQCGDTKEAYLNISFEREARIGELSENYFEWRKAYEWIFRY